MIISFVIFIGFLMFLIAIFPFRNPEKTTIGLDAAERGITNFSDMNLVYLTIALNETARDKIATNAVKCFFLDPNITLDKIIVKNETGSIVQSSVRLAGTKKAVYINGAGKFYQIYSSPDFQISSYNDNCIEIKESDGLSFGLVRRSQTLSYRKLLNLNTSYYLNYNNLRTQFSIPPREDFGFILREVNGAEILRAMKSRPARANVFARDVPIEVSYDNGTFGYFVLNVQSW